MNKISWKYFWFSLALAIPMGFQNCTPSQFTNSTAEGKRALSSASVAMASCNGHASGSRWWELDVNTETLACPGGNPIQLQYYLEKLCNNGVTTSTGQRVASGTNPVCQTVCQSQTTTWTSVEGQIQQTLSCSGGTTAPVVYERLVQYACVSNRPQATGTVTAGSRISGGCASSPSANACVNSTNGQGQSEGAVWQEPTADLTYSQSCPGSSTLAQYSCQRFFEYQCVGGTKQLTTREVVTMNCLATTACSNPTGSCSTESGTYANLATWTARISPDFSDPGNCTAGGDLVINSERMQSYQCSDGNVIAQQVVRGSTVSQTGQCGPKTCAVTNGTGQQNWTTIGGVAQWGACTATTCNSGYELLNSQCLAVCPMGKIRNSTTLVCETPVCQVPGGTQVCAVPNGTGLQTCSNDRMSWSACAVDSCVAGYILRSNACVLAKTIQIQTANYGNNFGYANNATGHMASVCNGLYSCSYYITTSNLGDPKPGWSKDFRVYYDCKDGVQRTAYVNPEANTSTVHISCPAQ